MKFKLIGIFVSKIYTIRMLKITYTHTHRETHRESNYIIKLYGLFSFVWPLTAVKYTVISHNVVATCVKLLQTLY